MEKQVKGKGCYKNKNNNNNNSSSSNPDDDDELKHTFINTYADYGIHRRHRHLHYHHP